MSIYLTIAMQLFGRSGDTLSHVVVGEGLESRDFYYPKPDSYDPTCEDLAAATGVHLAFIPYISLRALGRELLELISKPS